MYYWFTYYWFMYYWFIYYWFAYYWFTYYWLRTLGFRTRFRTPERPYITAAGDEEIHSDVHRAQHMILY